MPGAACSTPDEKDGAAAPEGLTCYDDHDSGGFDLANKKFPVGATHGRYNQQAGYLSRFYEWP